ncbi:trypsin-like peptidase domain-containing protein [Roseiconus lacunae]|uniref:Trypsin-like peptidase domain-containing protein n=1 Tax=Roseiconus lacunae TaxID=2605694 RepID=A0ABT7PM41_9BACT|nr:trypsin-like peptidase domain-containing protein [Roseiconus lacunae]MCD0461497.1 trypsin-like peptidase domain-containing protein [Roseiconus lacunae]MDM4017574.1 trypsin-like peptidase domain-containing protein [Roseiconus lacunae]WRQ51160.1 trypsin-like peptidase domain-containing protein [Stieleria sp. HD01]
MRPIQISPAIGRRRRKTQRWYSRFAKYGLTFSIASAICVADVSAQQSALTSFESSVPVGRVSDSNRETPTVLAVRRASPAVVNLHGQKTVRSTAAGMAGGTGDGGFKHVNGMGTGVIIDPAGYVITNYHVVEDVDNIRVTLHDGSVTTARLIASRPRNDLALVKISTDQPLPTIPRGTSSDLMVGESVIAIGNAYGYVHTCTQGIVSALHRDVPVNDTQDYQDLIQISAGINPGNSGGPLLNIDGEIIGVNVAVRVGAQQIAFAIPIDQVVDIVTSMIEEHNATRLDTGLSTQGGPRDGDGVTITHVSASSSAARDGLKPGDRVVRVGARSVDDRLDYSLAMLHARPGQNLPIEVERDGQAIQLALAASNRSQQGQGSSDAAWSVIGIRAKPISQSAMNRLNARMRTPYRGGLMITSVRTGSEAAEQGIQVGDVLLGIHNWQTASLSDLAGILDHPDIKKGPKAKFYIVRREQTLYGHFQLAARDQTQHH